ncbi:hypothetical protein V1292_004253 [Bradyrhizobium sp. AZCC 1719]
MQKNSRLMRLPAASRSLVTGLIAAASTALILSSTWAPAQEVKVGVQLPYTGVGAENAQQIDRGLDLYLKLNNVRRRDHRRALRRVRSRAYARPRRTGRPRHRPHDLSERRWRHRRFKHRPPCPLGLQRTASCLRDGADVCFGSRKRHRARSLTARVSRRSSALQHGSRVRRQPQALEDRRWLHDNLPVGQRVAP